MKNRQQLLSETFIICLLFFCACWQQQVEVQLKVQAKDSQNKPVSGARVQINDEYIGDTNTQGIFVKKVSLPMASTARVEITKDDPSFYIAPYVETFRLPDHQKKVDLDLSATLFFVPKPGVTLTNDEYADHQGNDAKVGLPQEGSEIAATKNKTAADDAIAPSLADKKESTKPKDESSIASTDVNDQHQELPVPTEQTIRPQTDLVNISAHDEEPRFSRQQHQQHGSHIFTIHVYSAQQPVHSALVYLGDTQLGSLTLGCKTNKRGRCVIRFKELPQEAVSFVVKKKSYETQTIRQTIVDNGILRVNLKRGQTIDVFALIKTYGYTRGIPSAQVFVLGKEVGRTDEFGHLAYVYTGKSSDLVDIRIRVDGYLPEEYETDFIMSGPTTLVRYFAQKKPHKARVSLLPLKISGKSLNAKMTTVSKHLEKNLTASLQQTVFSQAAFVFVSGLQLQQAAQSAGLSQEELVTKGWSTTSLKGIVDALIVPTLVVGKAPSLELSFIDAQGRVLAAAEDRLEHLTDLGAVKLVVEKIAKKIFRQFPFEGAILGQKDSQYIINLGRRSGVGIQPGDFVEVQGIQSDRMGRSKVHQSIATLVVDKVNEDDSWAHVVKMSPRAVISRGDLVILHAKKFSDLKTATLKVFYKDNGETYPVRQANVYFNGRWVGATDSSGTAILPQELMGIRGFMKIVKFGFEPFTQELTARKGAQLKASLKKQSSYLTIDTTPSGCLVYVDDQQVGVSPINQPVAIPSGFIKIKVVGPKGYKVFTEVFEVKGTHLDLTAARKIVLEKDYRTSILTLINQKRFKELVSVVSGIAANHSDYLWAHYKLGEVYLSQLKQPEKAWEAFQIVLKDDEVQNFNNKKFIGAYINAALASFEIAERLRAIKQGEAVQYYAHTRRLLEKVEPYLRFISTKQQQSARQTVAYYKALSLQRVGVVTQNPVVLDEALELFSQYLEEFKGQTVSADKLTEARTYYRQLLALKSQKNQRR